MFGNVIFLLVIIATAIHGSFIKSNGFELEGRITGGEDTKIENYPHMVSVRFANFHLCGGTIISVRVVVTSAHCVYPSVYPNIHSIQYATSVIGGMNNVITAERTLRHENYSVTHYNNDIGLLFLSSEIPLNAGAKLIQLATNVPAAGDSAIILGWGSSYANGPIASILEKAVVQVIDRLVCQQQYKGINKITLSNLCAGVPAGGIDACKLDSGGPLIINGQLAGIISYGYGCGDKNHAGVYSNVTALKNWIEKNMVI